MRRRSRPRRRWGPPRTPLPRPSPLARPAAMAEPFSPSAQSPLRPRSRSQRRRPSACPTSCSTPGNRRRLPARPARAAPGAPVTVRALGTSGAELRDHNGSPSYITICAQVAHEHERGHPPAPRPPRITAERRAYPSAPEHASLLTAVWPPPPFVLIGHAASLTPY